MMHLQSKIWVRQNVEQVVSFFYTEDSFVKCSNRVIQSTPANNYLNKPLQTSTNFSHEASTINYNLIGSNPAGSITLLVVHSGRIKKATWHFEFTASGSGTDIFCDVHFTLKFPYQFLYPVLYLNKNVLTHKLKYLEKALDENYLANLASSIKKYSGPVTGKELLV
jgi:hypothetical protein